MKINIFEGGRRIHGVISWGALIVAVIVGFMEEPNLTIRYEVLSLGAPPRITTDECKFNDLEEFRYHESKKGKSYQSSICFRALKASDGEVLIPYKAADKGMYYMASKWSDNVKNYALQVSNTFEPRKEDIENVDMLLLWEKAKLIARDVGGTCIGLLVFWIVSAVMGWVLRGFLGIPAGMDARPPAT